LLRNETFSGGHKRAFDKETKIRTFVNLILMHTLDKYDVTREEEQWIIFNEEKCVPDITILSNQGGTDDPLFIIELKKPSSDLLEGDLHQNFKQLRHFCVANHKSRALGILTNHFEWYFTSFNFQEEFAKAFS
jgi:hypothetical protein